MKTLIPLFLLLFGFQTIFAQHWYQKQAFAASIECDDCREGFSVSVLNGRAFVANYFAFGGAVGLYEKDSISRWQFKQQIFPLDIEPGIEFGYSIAQTDEYLFAGSIYNFRDQTGGNLIGHAGAAYVFTRGSNGLWQQTQKLIPSERGESFYFGHAMVSVGEYLAVSANWNTVVNQVGDSIERAGAVYLFEKDTSGFWIETQSLRLTDPKRQDEFGDAIAMSETQLFVGVPQKTRLDLNADTLQQKGAVYVYQKDSTGSWIERQQLVPSTLTSGDGLGQAISYQQQTLFVGAPGSAQVYVFQQDSSGFWSETQILSVADSISNRPVSFGASVAVDGRYAVIGAPHADRYGACWMFEELGGTWQQMQHLTADYDPVPTSTEAFGRSVSLSGKQVLIGMPFRNAMIPNPNNTPYSYRVGGVFFYEFTESPLSLEQQSPAQSLAISPNPCQGFAQIDFELAQSQNLLLRVTDLSGKVVYQEALGIRPVGKQERTINTATLSPGIYLVSVLGEWVHTTSKLLISAH
ncbi:MAG: T9SS type A sorting domain-containing protein [Bacteroidota bacterium]